VLSWNRTAPLTGTAATFTSFQISNYPQPQVHKKCENIKESFYHGLRDGGNL